MNVADGWSARGAFHRVYSAAERLGCTTILKRITVGVFRDRCAERRAAEESAGLWMRHSGLGGEFGRFCCLTFTKKDGRDIIRGFSIFMAGGGVKKVVVGRTTHRARAIERPCRSRSARDILCCLGLGSESTYRHNGRAEVHHRRGEVVREMHRLVRQRFRIGLSACSAPHSFRPTSARATR